ncbi:hypothetical protein AEA09_11155 [Lysinibacillus contaminans]|uniref:Uncharacterized protein n=1 Tax=Lysinibacillus contaminans TaxID=1293441 RepID=A0ABR5K296_9BACI|nr:hypothetical protein AEA09_11155 [Lysinibacillus contaminans]
MKQKFFTGLSVACLVLTFLIFGYDSTKWYGKFIDFLFDISIFTPLIIGALGILSAFLGIKGTIRMILILVNSFFLIVFLCAILLGILGFHRP